METFTTWISTNYQTIMVILVTIVAGSFVLKEIRARKHYNR